MLCGQEITGWASRIWQGLNDSTLTTGGIANWLTNNLYLLNISLNVDFSVSGSGCVVPDMTTNISGLYEEMYYCDYLRKKSTSLLGGLTFKDVVEFEGAEQGRVRYVSLNERSKVLRTAATDCKTNLVELINWYNDNFGGQTYAYQVLYNLRDDPAGYGLKPYCPPDYYYSSCNTVWGVNWSAI